MDNQLAKWRYLVESITKEKLELLPLKYSASALSPAMSAKNVEYHYGTLSRGYVDRYNSGDGDPDFNEAGAFLHNLYWAQFKSFKVQNRPSSESLKFIAASHGTLDKLQDAFEQEMMSLQGSGWIVFTKSGEIKTIHNHKIRKDILILADFWEHAWQYEFDKPDKKKFLKNFWKIIDWSVIDSRL